MIKHLLLALAIVCGIGGVTLTLAGLSAHPAAACDQYKTS